MIESEERKYGKNIPSLSFRDTIAAAIKIYETSGATNSMDAMAHALDNLPTSSTFKKKWQTLKKFGLVDSLDGNYNVSGITRRLANPKSPQDYAQALRDAFGNHPDLFAAWEHYAGQLLPETKFVANFFGDVLGMPIEVRMDWARYFEEGGIFAGIIQVKESGKRYVASPNSRPAYGPPNNLQREQSPEPTVQDSKHDLQFNNQPESGSRILSKRIGGDQKIRISIPFPLTQETYKEISKAFDFFRDTMEDWITSSEDEVE